MAAGIEAVASDRWLVKRALRVLVARWKPFAACFHSPVQCQYPMYNFFGRNTMAVIAVHPGKRLAEELKRFGLSAADVIQRIHRPQVANILRTIAAEYPAKP